MITEPGKYTLGMELTDSDITAQNFMSSETGLEFWDWNWTVMWNLLKKKFSSHEYGTDTWNLLFHLDWNQCFFCCGIVFFCCGIVFSVVELMTIGMELRNAEPGICSWHGIDEYLRNPPPV